MRHTFTISGSQALQLDRSVFAPNPIMQSPVDQPIAPSRPSLSDRGDRGDSKQQEGPIALFDYHLRILSDSYLNFFQER